MNGYEMMADSYRQLVKQGKIDKETADREIRVYDFLATSGVLLLGMLQPIVLVLIVALALSALRPVVQRLRCRYCSSFRLIRRASS